MGKQLGFFWVQSRQRMSILLSNSELSKDVVLPDVTLTELVLTLSLFGAGGPCQRAASTKPRTTQD